MINLCVCSLHKLFILLLNKQAIMAKSFPSFVRLNYSILTVCVSSGNSNLNSFIIAIQNPYFLTFFQDPEPTEHEANDSGPSRMMSSYGCAENRLPDHHWPPQAFRAGLPIPPSGPIFGPPGIYPPPGGDRPPPPHRMSPPASW